jgi:hypothetical protein
MDQHRAMVVGCWIHFLHLDVFWAQLEVTQTSSKIKKEKGFSPMKPTDYHSGDDSSLENKVY